MSASTLSASKPLLAGYVESILAAPVYDVAVETPLQVAPQLSQRLGNRVLLKREDLQPVFSFKIRGAYTRVARLSDEQKARGVITASAGNHAQGLALAAQRLGVRAVIVMPRTTPELKVKGVLARGGEALLHGDAFPDALAHALQLAEREGMTFVPPYDDPDVIAGQGTVAMEILRQHSGRLDAIFVPVGGGSLIAGIAAYVKHLRPDIRVIGVEPEDSNCLQAALAAGERVVLGQVGLFADGVAVAQIGACNFEVCKDHVDEVITVGSDEICAAIKDIYDDTRSITEPAGALAVAGIKKYVARERTEGQTLVAIDSGANINFDRLRHVAERAELGEQPAHREKEFGIWLSHSWNDFYTRAKYIGLGLVSLGLKRGEVISVLSEDNKEWVYIDLATQCVGAICSGIYTTDSASQLSYLVNDSNSKFLFVENDEQLDKYLETEKTLTGLTKTVVLDRDGLHDFSHPDVMFLDDLYALGREFEKANPGRFEEEIALSQPDDTAILVYTSGTTGMPKGAMISHGNVFFSLASGL